MATTSSGGGVTDTVRQQLAAGYSGDQIVEGLMAGGLSRPSAERFVTRAGGQVTPPVLAASPPPMPTAVPPPVPAFAAVPVASPPPLPAAPTGAPAWAPAADTSYGSQSYALPSYASPPVDAPPPLPAWAPPPVPAAYAGSAVSQTPFAPATYPQNSSPYPAYGGATAAASSPKSSLNGLKLAGGAALLLVGVLLLVASLSATSGRVRLKLPLALVFGGGVTLVQAIRER
jgi:hypothetical protein